METFKPNSNCLRCGKNSLLTDESTGEEFCSKCGFVIDEKISDSGPERIFSDNTNNTRTGMPISLTIHDMGLSTIINPSNKDATAVIRRLRIWDNRSHVSKSDAKNLRQAFGELSRLKDKVSVSENVFEKTAYIYRKALEKKLIRGRSISSMIAASLYAACRESETPRNLREIAHAANVTRTDISRCYRLLHNELELEMPVIDPIQCIARISSKLEIPEKTKRDAAKILKEAQDRKESSGKDPMGLAASALYMSCVKNRISMTQRQVAEAAGITEVTIRNRCKGLKQANIKSGILMFMSSDVIFWASL